MLRKFALLCALLSLGACQSTPWNEDAPGGLGAEPVPGSPAPIDAGGLLPSVNRRFKDVPLPVEATEDLERSYVYESSNLQIGRMVYTSRASVTALAQFYIDECQRIGWNLESALQANGTNLEFRKPGKKLTVSVEPQGVGRSNLLIVHLTPNESAGTTN